MRSITEAQRARILADLIAEAADGDNPLAVLDDGEFLKTFFDAKGLETGGDEEGNPREDEALATAIVEEAYVHFEMLDDVVIAIGFANKSVEVFTRRDYIDYFLHLDPDRASDEEIEEAEDAGDGFMACESVREAYNAMSRWSFDTRIGVITRLMDSNYGDDFLEEAEEVYSDLRALWVDQVIAGVEGKLNPEANETEMDYEPWCDYYAACACNEVNDFAEVDIPARDAKDGKAFTIWFEAPEELE